MQVNDVNEFRVYWRYADRPEVETYYLQDCPTLESAQEEADKLVRDEDRFGSSPGIVIMIQRFAAVGDAVVTRTPARGSGTFQDDPRRI